MTNYISCNPLLMVVPPESQAERLDTPYYHPRFADLDDILNGQAYPCRTVEDLTTLVTDGTHVTPRYVDDGVVFLSAGNLKERGILWEDVKYISHQEHQSLSNCQPQANDVLVAKSGTVGVACVFPKDAPECSVYESVAIVRPKAAEIRADFLALFINSDLCLKQIQRSQKGIAIKHLHLTDLRGLRVPYLDPSDQQEVVRRYARVVAMANVLCKEADTSEALRNDRLISMDAVFAHELKIRRFPEPWFGRISVLPPQEIVDRLDVLGANRRFIKACAACSCFVPISTVCKIDGSNSQIPLGNQRYLAINMLPGDYWGEIEPVRIEVDERVGRKRFEAGDIAWAHLKPSILQGKTFIVREPCWGSHHFVRLATAELNEDARLVVWTYLKLRPIKRHLANQCTGKSESQKDISAEQLASLPFPSLTNEQMTRIAVAVRSRIAETHHLMRRANVLRAQADAIVAAAKRNIFDLLDEGRFKSIMVMAERAKNSAQDAEVA